MINIKKEYMHIFCYMLILAGAVGIIVGFLEVIFLKTTIFCMELRKTQQWLIFILPLCGAIIGWVYRKHGKAVSKGNNLLIDWFHKSEQGEEVGKKIPAKMAPIIWGNCILTLLGGGSVGRTGACMQSGASISTMMAEGFQKLYASRQNQTSKQEFTIGREEFSILVRAGIAAGFAAALRAPVAGVLFAVEFDTPGKMKHQAIFPCLLAGFMSNCMCMFYGIPKLKFRLSGKLDFDWSLSIKLIVAVILFGCVSRIFTLLLHYCKAIMQQKFPDPIQKGVIIGCLIVILTIWSGGQQYNGLGSELLQSAVRNQMINYDFVMKMIFTVLSISAGFAGGEVMPYLVTGALFGSSLAPLIGLPIGLTAAMGAVCTLSAALNLPLVGLALAVEMFGSGHYVIVMLAIILSGYVAGSESLYPAQKIVPWEGFQLHVRKLGYNIVINSEVSSFTKGLVRRIGIHTRS